MSRPVLITAAALAELGWVEIETAASDSKLFVRAARAGGRVRVETSNLDAVWLAPSQRVRVLMPAESSR